MSQKSPISTLREAIYLLILIYISSANHCMGFDLNVKSNKSNYNSEQNAERQLPTREMEISDQKKLDQEPSIFLNICGQYKAIISNEYIMRHLIKIKFLKRYEHIKNNRKDSIDLSKLAQKMLNETADTFCWHIELEQCRYRRLVRAIMSMKLDKPVNRIRAIILIKQTLKQYQLTNQQDRQELQKKCNQIIKTKQQLKLKQKKKERRKLNRHKRRHEQKLENHK